MAVLVALNDAEDTLFGQHLRAIGAGHRLALIRRQRVGALRRYRAAGAQGADDVRHPPDAVLVGHQDVVTPEGKAIGLVEVLDMPVDPNRAALAVVAQQGQIAGTLLGDQHIAVGQHQQAPRIGETGRKRRRRETGRNLQALPVKRHGQRPVGYDRRRLWRREVVGVDMKTPADLVLGRKILRQLILRSRSLTARRIVLDTYGQQHKHARSQPSQRDVAYAGIFHHGRPPKSDTSPRTERRPAIVVPESRCILRVRSREGRRFRLSPAGSLRARKISLLLLR